MGSSKKHKEKDKKKRKRESSSSRTRDRKHRHHHKHHHKKHKRAREERSPTISLSDLSDVEGEIVPKLNHDKDEGYPPISFTPPPIIQPPSPLAPEPYLSRDANGEEAAGGNEISMSIEETNKIRAKLGLKPLEVKPEIKTIKDESDIPQGGDYKPGDVVHMPAKNIRDKLNEEKLREKIALQKEKRENAVKVSHLKTLGEVSDAEEDSATAWVKKSRKVEKQKKEAEKRNKMLEDLDEQFGIGDLVDEEISHVKKNMYDSRNLSGLRVLHDAERFSEGQYTVLTLKDSNILDTEEDTLVNVNIVDTERVEMNLKRKRTKLNDVEYEAPEVDEYGNLVQQSLLTKYDEEIDGEKKKSFRIGQSGAGFKPASADSNKNKMLKLRQMTTLLTPESQLASEYLTPDEISFKKVKKKKKKRKMLTADDLIPLEEAEQHWGSRNLKTSNEIKREGDSDSRVKSLKELMEEEDDIVNLQRMDIDITAEQDKEGDKEVVELQEALTRSRRAKINLRHRIKQEDSLSAFTTSSLPKDDLGPMTLNLTDEFCRTLGDIPTYGLSGNRAEDEATLIADRSSKTEPESWEQKGAWEEVHIDDTKVEIENEKSVPILEEEPDTGKGVVNALKLAIKKGYLQKDDEKKIPSSSLQHLRAVNYSIDDKAVEDDRRGGASGRGSDRYLGPIMDFRDKDSYKPDIKLEYIDDEGRKLSAKEAFRYLSHRFHGKGSGKNKMEKRMKKWQEELLMKHMSSSDTPLQTLERQMEKQKQIGSAYLLLSGNVSQESIDVKK